MEEIELNQLIGHNIILKKVIGKNSRGDKLGLFTCHCGNNFEWIIKRIKGGEKRNCGCNTFKLNPNLSTKKNSEAYGSWAAMKSRCSGHGNDQYKKDLYTKENIIICDRWINSYENFLNDMGPKPSSKYSLDRINGNLGYSPENCRWATSKEQVDNRSSSKWITYNGVTKIMKDWSRSLNINYSTFRTLMIKNNLSIELVLEYLEEKIEL